MGKNKVKGGKPFPLSEGEDIVFVSPANKILIVTLASMIGLLGYLVIKSLSPLGN